MGAELVLVPHPTPPRRPTVGTRLRWQARRAPHMARQLPSTCRRELRFAARGTAMTYRAWRRWCRVEEWAEAAKVAEGDARAKHLERIEGQRRNRRKLTFAGTFLVVAALVTSMLWQPFLPAAVAILTVAVLDAVGRRHVEDLGLEKGRVEPFREGASLRSVVASVKEYLADSKTPAKVTAASYDGADGIALQVRHDGHLDAGFTEGLERWLRTYRGAVMAVEDKTARGGSRVTVSWRDRLAVSTAPPMLAPMSRHGAEPATVGVSANGQPTVIDRWRTNVTLVGKPGSGKSSAGWVLLDADTANPDIRVVGIDLRGGGGPLLNAWGDLVETMATTESEADVLLDKLLAEAQGRTSMLGARSRPGARNPGPENWTPRDGEQWVLYIEELPLLANHKNLVGKYAELLRVGRAPAVVSVALSQDMGRETVGSTGLRKHVMTTVLFACARDDVVQLFGAGALAEGWRPDLLHPADGISVNDAGRAYIRSPRYPMPMQHRWYRLDDAATDIHPRVHARLAARGQVQAEDDVVEASVLSDLQVAVSAVFDAEHADWLPTRVILAALAEDGIDVDAKTLAKDLSGERTRRKWGGVPQVWGYARDAI